MIAYFSRFEPRHLVELRILRHGEVQRVWFAAHDYPRGEALIRRCNDAGWDVYASVNPRAHHGGSREDSVAELVTFHADVDHGVLRTQTPPSKRAPAPSMIVDSGRGRHLYWHLTSPIPVTADNRAALKGINRGLALAVGGDPACHDLARILRVPGWLNWKYNPPRLVELLEANDVRYTVEELAPFAVPVAAQPPVREVEVAPLTAELRERFNEARAKDATGSIARAWRGEIGDGSSDSRYVLAKMLTAQSFSAGEIAAIVCSRGWYNRKERRAQTPERVLRHALRLAALFGGFCVRSTLGSTSPLTHGTDCQPRRKSAQQNSR